MRVILTTSALVLLLLLASLVLAIAGEANTADACWQGALIVLVVGALAFAARFLPDGPIGAADPGANLFDDPDSFWGRWNRFYRG